jgi:hypothetical protein
MAEEDAISEKQMKFITSLLHQKADVEKRDFKEIRKQFKEENGYTNLQTISRGKAHQLLNNLMEELGIEKINNNGNKPKKTENKPNSEEMEEKKQDLKLEDKDGEIIDDMQKFIRAAVSITEEEVLSHEIPIQGLGGFIQKIATCMLLVKYRIDTEEAKGAGN